MALITIVIKKNGIDRTKHAIQVQVYYIDNSKNKNKGKKLDS